METIVNKWSFILDIIKISYMVTNYGWSYVVEGHIFFPTYSRQPILACNDWMSSYLCPVEISGNQSLPWVIMICAWGTQYIVDLKRPICDVTGPFVMSWEQAVFSSIWYWWTLIDWLMLISCVLSLLEILFSKKAYLDKLNNFIYIW